MDSILTMETEVDYLPTSTDEYRRDEENFGLLVTS